MFIFLFICPAMSSNFKSILKKTLSLALENVFYVPQWL